MSKLADRIDHVSFASGALKTSKRFCVVLPENYSANQADWPVLYLLHGRGRTELIVSGRRSGPRGTFEAAVRDRAPGGR